MDGDLIMKILLIDLNDRFALITLLLSTFASRQSTFTGYALVSIQLESSIDTSISNVQLS